MHELLQPAPPDPALAGDRVRAWLRRRRPSWSLALRTEREPLRSDLAALGAWWALLEELSRSGDAAGLEAAGAELDAALADAPQTPLGLALGRAAARHRLPGLLLRGQVQALRRDLAVATWETRDALLAHARRTSQPVGRTVLRVLGLANERTDVLADALGVGVQLALWIASVPEDWSRGRLRLPVEDLARFGVELRQLDERRVDDAARRLFATEIEWARSFLAKGWPLALELGPRRGRILALYLRWRSADLSAIEARRLDGLTAPPRRGSLRLVACLAASAVSPRV